MHSRERRLRALERGSHSGTHVVLVAEAWSPWTEAAALSAVGLKPAKDDLVVFIKRFSPGSGPRFSLVG